MIYCHRKTPLHELAYLCVKDIEPHLSEFDYIAVRGVSGIAVGAAVACSLGVPLVVVRKKDDNHHGSSQIEGLEHVTGKRSKRGLFLDDFVSMGTTRAAVAKSIETFGGKLVAQYEYNHEHYKEIDHERIRNRMPDPS